MKWLDNIEAELQRIRPEENPGRTRTAARRIAGIALQHFYDKSSNDFLRVLHSAAGDVSIPDEVRSAIERLITRLDENFSSPSIDPVADAMIVVEFVRDHSIGNQ